jgi:hypothetical protein
MSLCSTLESDGPFIFQTAVNNINPDLLRFVLFHGSVEATQTDRSMQDPQLS